MSTNATSTLFHPFETEALGPSAEGVRALFLGAEPGFRSPEAFKASILAVQGFRPAYLTLEREGRTVVALPEGAAYDLALVLASRHRGESELRVADALERVRTGGLIVIAGSKDDGIASLRKRVAALVPVEGHLSKYHGVAFWLRRGNEAPDAAGTLRRANCETLIDGRFHTAPGMFSAGGIDPGSQLLADSLPGDIKGHVADFCAGWGFVARTIADRFPQVATLDLYEADFRAIQAARQNLESAKTKTAFHWHDLVGEEVADRYDTVVMNPPFHTSRRAEPDIGQSLIRAAAKALKRGGRLLMVANRQLPYEETLAGAFTRFSQINGDGKYKVFCAWR